jgi:hypothetical protein
MPTEYEFAVALHWYPVVAWLYPVLLDTYSVIAYWTHRQADIATTIGLKLAANIGAHLAAADMIDVNAAVLAAGTGIVVIVGWRLHAMMAPKRPKKTKAKKAAVVQPAPVAPAPVVVVPDSPAGLEALGPAEPEPAAVDRPAEPYGPAPENVHPETFEKVARAALDQPAASHAELAAGTGLSVKTIQRAVKGLEFNLRAGLATAPAAA